MFCVYVIKSAKSNQLYFGSTNDPRRRFAEHNSGLSGHTKKHMPYKLIYYEAYGSEEDARTRELSLKLRANAFNQLKRRIVASLKAN